MNFAEMIRPHVVPAVSERFCVKGRRTHNHTGETKAVRCVFEVGDGTAGKVLRLVEGGVTGYESFYVSGEFARKGILEDEGSWCACAMTKDRWDELVIEADEMAAVRAWARGKI